MRAISFATVCLILSLALSALAAEPDIRLVGFINLPTFRKVVILQDLQDSKHRARILGKGEREGEVEVVAISPTELSATLTVHTNRNVKLTMEGAKIDPGTPTPTILLQNVNFRSVLDLYQNFCQRTLLMHPKLSNAPFTFRSSATNEAGAVGDLQKAFAEREIVMVPDGEKFLMIAPEYAAASLQPRSMQAKPNDSNGDPHKEEMIPPGTIDFRGADTYQVLAVYGMLVDHKLSQTSRLPPHDFSGYFLKTQTPLSRTEAIYALEALVNLHGLNVVTQSDGSIAGVLPPK
jgi:hypothetical protein